jgi:(E)-4-hydroxy-3-methylbut-2-enyl-diphosphate synthase
LPTPCSSRPVPAFFKTDYVACPSCGRTLFDLQSTTARIKESTLHLKGVKIAIMGCIVNGPGEMADADFRLCGRCALGR